MGMTSESLRKLTESRIYMVATPGGESHTAFRIARPVPIMVQGGSFLYVPKWPKDWLAHPAAYRAMVLIIIGELNIPQFQSRKAMRPGELFFFIPKDRAEAVASGEQTEEDILMGLEDSL